MFERLATGRGISTSVLITAIDESRSANLSSAIRLFVLAELEGGSALPRS